MLLAWIYYKKPISIFYAATANPIVILTSAKGYISKILSIPNYEKVQAIIFACMMKQR